MANPQKGNIVYAKELSPTAYDDILGNFRVSFVRKVEAAIQYHKDNVADPLKTVYRLGVGDSQNPSPAGFSDVIPINSVPHYFKKGGAKLVLTDVFNGPKADLPDDGQVPQNQGDRIDGQRSFWDTNGGTGVGVPGTEAASIQTSVAHAIAMHTSAISKIRKGTITERMAITDRDYNSKTYPATFDGVEIPVKGDTLVTVEQWYTFSQQGQKAGITHFAEPFRSALDYNTVSWTIVSDPMRGPRIDAGGQGGGPDPMGVYIAKDTLDLVVSRMQQVWLESKNYTASVVLDYCHTSCHASCHNSRSRR